MTMAHPPTDDMQSTGDGMTSGIPARHHDEDAAEAVADAARPINISAPADTDDTASVELTRCGWCGGMQFIPTPKESGRMYCACGSVYNPLTGGWAPGRQERRQRPPAPLASGSGMTQDKLRDKAERSHGQLGAGGHLAMDGQ